MSDILSEFLIRADEGSEMLADMGMDIIRQARAQEGLTGPIPDPISLSHANLRLLIRAVYKAGVTFGFEEVINIYRKIE